MLKVLKTELQFWLWDFTSAIPGRFGWLIRGWIARLFVKGKGTLRVGKRVDFSTGYIEANDNVFFHNNCSVRAHDGVVKIGSDVGFNANCIIDAGGGGIITIGDQSLIGPNVVIRACDHEFSDISKPIREQGHRVGNITIEQDVWLGANVVITSGVTVGAQAIVAAGSIVTKDVPSRAVVGGIPAKVIKFRE